MSVYQRNGRWHLSVSINGRRIRRAIKEAQTKRQAERAERILRNEIYENRYGRGGQKLFADFVENSYKPYAKEHKKGYEVECSVLRVLIERFGKYRLSEILPEEIERFKRHRSSEITTRGTQRSRATVNRDVAVLSAVFNLAKEFGEIKENPVSSVRYYTGLASRDRVLSDDEEDRLFTHIAGDRRLSQQLEVLLYTALRRGELFKIEWSDLDYSDNEAFINVRAEITKTGQRREVPMFPNVVAIFEERRRELGNVADSDRIFPGPKTAPSALSFKFRTVCKQLGIEGVTVHTLRHTYSTRANRFGVGPFAQRDILGHSKLTMTGKYTHPAKETIRASLVNFAAFVAARPTKR